MNVSRLSLKDLEYLVAVAVQGHFGKAAEACHVSQPALSAQIKKVEEYFQLRIFERNNRRVLIDLRPVLAPGLQCRPREKLFL